MGIVKNAEGEKVGKKSKKVENNYVNDAGISPYFFGQKGAVEKAVESVEKSILSTKKRKMPWEWRKQKPHFFEKNGADKVAVIMCYGNGNCKEVPVLFW